MHIYEAGTLAHQYPGMHTAYSPYESPYEKEHLDLDTDLDTDKVNSFNTTYLWSLTHKMTKGLWTPDYKTYTWPFPTLVPQSSQ